MFRLMACIVCITAIGLVGCDLDLSNLTKRVPNPQNLPVYSGAQQVQTRVETDIHGATVHITRFETSDQPEVVRQYYKTALQADGWQYGEQWDPIARPNNMNFYYEDPKAKGYEGVISVDVVVTGSQSGGQTVVELQAHY